MGLFSSSDSSSDDDRRQHTASGGGQIIDLTKSKKNNVNVRITDGGAIAGNVAVANNALNTAKTITQQIGDQFGDQQRRTLTAVENVTGKFGQALESIKKTELTGGGSLLFDNLKYWPVVPVAFVLVALIRNGGRGKK